MSEIRYKAGLNGIIAHRDDDGYRGSCNSCRRCHVATEGDRTRAAVVKALRKAAEVVADESYECYARLADIANAIESGADL